MKSKIVSIIIFLIIAYMGSILGEWSYDNLEERCCYMMCGRTHAFYDCLPQTIADMLIFFGIFFTIIFLVWCIVEWLDKNTKLEGARK